MTEAENFIVDETKNENEEKENLNEGFSNPEKKQKLDAISCENRPNGEDQRARKVSKMYFETTFIREIIYRGITVKKLP